MPGIHHAIVAGVESAMHYCFVDHYRLHCAFWLSCSLVLYFIVGPMSNCEVNNDDC